MKRNLPLLIAAAALAAGCMAPIERRDTLADLKMASSEESPYRSLSVALVDSENTKQSAQYLRNMNGISNFLAPWARVDVEQILKGARDVFEKNFKKTIRVDDLPAAKASEAEIVAVLDIFAEPGNTSLKTKGQNTKMDVSAIFMTKDEKQIDVVKGKGERAVGMFSFMAAEAANDAWNGLESALLHSEKLLSFAKTGALPAAGPPASDVVEKRPGTAAYHSDVDRPSRRLPERPDDFALVVGVEKYSNDLPEAQFAERDALAVKDHLLALGFPERNIKLLTGQRASFSAFAAYLEDWLPRNVNGASRVFFYFSGHGAPDPESGQAYLVPWDGNPNFLEKTSFPVKKLYADLDSLKAKQVIVALDSCFSGAGGRSLLAEGTRPLVSKVDYSVSPSGKIILFAAASPKEVTSTLKEQGHGIFTYYFLKGLDGAAKDASGAVTPRGLYEYLKPKVQDAASRQNRDQTPVLEGAVEGEITRF